VKFTIHWTTTSPELNNYLGAERRQWPSIRRHDCAAGFGVNNWFMDLTIAWGICCNVQRLLMTLLLPTWHRDVPTRFHAFKLRSDMV
jgi:hypothetical protein